MNKIILSSALVAIIVVGGLGMYLSSTTHAPQSVPVSNPENVPIKTAQSPPKFPYQFSKEVFDSTVFPKISFLSNEPIKFESSKEIVDYLKQSQKIQQQYNLFVHSPDMLMAPVPSPEPESMKMPRPEMPTHGGTVSLDRSVFPTPFGTEWNSGEEVHVQLNDADANLNSRSDYSTTNVQVKNVDEPDYLKTD